MAQTLRVINFVQMILFGSFALAGEGHGHSHGPEVDHTMQVIGALVSLVIAGIVVWFLNYRKK